MYVCKGGVWIVEWVWTHQRYIGRGVAASWDMDSCELVWVWLYQLISTVSGCSHDVTHIKMWSGCGHIKVWSVCGHIKVWSVCGHIKVWSVCSQYVWLCEVSVATYVVDHDHWV